MINFDQAAGLLWRVKGCVLSKYAFLVALSAQRAIGCADVDWHQTVGLISPEQAGWSKAALNAQGTVCNGPGTGTLSDPIGKGYPVDVGQGWSITVTG